MLDQRILESWNKMYINSIPEGHWCRILIPSVEWAVANLDIRPNFLLSQAITGHGALNAYLFKIGKRISPSCRCGLVDQTPEHVFRVCDLYKEGRPTDWRQGLANEDVRQYLIRTMKQLWEEEKDEEKTGLNRIIRTSRSRSNRAGVPITGAGPASSSR